MAQSRLQRSRRSLVHTATLARPSREKARGNPPRHFRAVSCGSGAHQPCYDGVRLPVSAVVTPVESARGQHVSVADVPTLTHAAPAERRRCLISPHCRPPEALGTGAVWLHLGPIAAARTQLAMHGEPVATMPPPPHNGATDAGAGRRCLIRLVETWPEHKAFAGCHLDLLGSTDRPAQPTRQLVLGPGCDTLWLIAAVAWMQPGGPFVEASFVEAAGPLIDWRFGGSRPTTDVVSLLGRLTDLVLGRGARVGRPSRYDLDVWRPIAERAERLKAEHPELPLSVIAARVNVHEATLREYRRLLRRDRESASHVVPTLVVGGADLP